MHWTMEGDLIFIQIPFSVESGKSWSKNVTKNVLCFQYFRGEALPPPRAISGPSVAYITKMKAQGSRRKSHLPCPKAPSILKSSFFSLGPQESLEN